MDPNATYREMLQAIESGDDESAREFARNLLHWLRSLGFPPAGQTSNDAIRQCRTVLGAKIN